MNLGLVVCLHQPYIRTCATDGDSNARDINEHLYYAISYTYLPFLELLERLERVAFCLNVYISGELCALLSDVKLMAGYVKWLEARIALGEKEVARLASTPEEAVALSILDKAKRDLDTFTVRYNSKLMDVFSYMGKEGKIELIGGPGTNVFFPHIAYSDELINAQIESGIIAHRKHFGTVAGGFWLPKLGYACGIEENLSLYGLVYTIVDSHAFLLSKEPPRYGTFLPTRSDGGLCYFARDYELQKLLTGESAYSNSAVYKDTSADIAWSLEQRKLAPFIKKNNPRIESGYKYYAKGNSGTEGKAVYEAQRAALKAKEDARDFLHRVDGRLSGAKSLIKGEPLALVTMDESVLGLEWEEGFLWLEELLRATSESKIHTVHLSSIVKGPKAWQYQKLSPWTSASSGMGYGEELLDITNVWMQPHLTKALERMVDLADRFKDNTGLKSRLLNFGAGQVLLAQSLDLKELCHSARRSIIAEHSFKELILNFCKVFDALGSNIVSTEWLVSMEKKYRLFTWLSYKVFSRKG